MNNGIIIKLLRTAKGIKQKAVCLQLGVSQQAYSLIEKKEYIERDILQKILAAMQSDLQEFEEVKKVLTSKKK